MKQKYFLLLLIGLPFLPSCSRFLDIPAPSTSLIDATVFQDSSTATAAVLGLYYRMMQNSFSIFDGGGVMMAGLQSDELRSMGSTANYDEFYTHTLAPTNFIVTGFWTELYQLVYQSNAVIGQLEGVANFSATLRDRLMGEALLVRGLALFKLQNWFGPVPIPLSTDYVINGRLSRRPISEVLAQVEDDWTRAAALLPDQYVGGSKTRPTKWAAYTMLSRLYLLQERWLEAEDAVTAVLAGIPQLELADQPTTVFMVNSSETIWHLRPVSTSANTSTASLLASVVGAVPHAATYQPAFVAGMVDEDLRLQQWIRTWESGGTRYWQPYKYKFTNVGQGTENLVLARLGELLLNRAEARAAQERPAEALEDLNAIRKRAGLADLDQVEDLMAAIRQERRWELQAEQDFRWTDLKRWGELDALLSIVKPGFWRPTAAVLPIPQLELNNNPSLYQNEGY